MIWNTHSRTMLGASMTSAGSPAAFTSMYSFCRLHDFLSSKRFQTSEWSQIFTFKLHTGVYQYSTFLSWTNLLIASHCAAYFVSITARGSQLAVEGA
jgi:hypothetical protein